jgi:hypothetical protein
MRITSLLMCLASELGRLICWCPERPNLKKKGRFEIRGVLLTSVRSLALTQNRSVAAHLILFGALLAGCYIYPYCFRMGGVFWLLPFFDILALATYFSCLAIRWICSKIEKSTRYTLEKSGRPDS